LGNRQTATFYWAVYILPIFMTCLCDIL